jgi:hypothetical protein
MQWHPVGTPLGILVGFITGFVYVVLILGIVRTRNLDLKAVGGYVAQLLALPTFWFGGPWVTTAILQPVNFAEVLPSYLDTLVLLFVVIALYPSLLLILVLGNRMAQMEAFTRAR